MKCTCLLVALLAPILAGGAPPVLAPAADAEPAMRRATQYAQRGHVDMMTASSAAWESAATMDRFWAPAFTLGTQMTDKLKAPWPLAHGGDKDFRAYVAGYDPTLLKQVEPFHEPPILGKDKRGACRRLGLVAPELSTNKAISNSLVLSRGSVRADKGMSWSVIYANGDVICDDDVNQVLVIADGEITIKRLVSNSILIARGNINVAAACESTLVSGGNVKVTLKNPAPLDPISKNVINNGEANPLGLITFFELSRVGVETAEKDKAVRVAKLTDASPLRKRGISVGDVIMKVNGTPIATAEELRRALRDAIATKGEATLTVVRDGKATEILVPLPD